ncbi:unnamed protein product [Darwinula stevensoni]|uniref:SHC-transforming protein 1 n=1 Tax=Darwinula stevensoni TaxID=69355 RepID=A0A7R9FR50_9CRUS|nr:unnamed protein product [Darwinula stevensoni]CAG0900338.1 unnamed protein product [Darwinula stevensoni]
MFQYIGCLGVNASMKTLDYDTRSQVAVECINRVCEAAGLKTVDKKRKVDKRIGSVLDEKPCMDHAGSNVTLRVTSACLRLCSLDTGQLISSHDMPNISFASGGDADTLDFVAFVAKDGAQGRACYVLECGGGLAQDVITTIGQAFELRFKEYLKKAPRTNGATSLRHCSESTSTTSLGARGPALGRGDPETDQEYYNDLPGKIPPDLGPTTSSLPPPLTMAPTLKKHPSDSPSSSAHRDASSDLIDLNSHPATPTTPATRTDVHEYVNDSVVFQKGSSRGAMGGVPPAPPPMPLTSTQTSIQKDPFDMQPFTAAIPSTSLVDGGGSLKAQLEKEPWFHGAISRKEAEALLKHDGEFLVRESQGSGGQYVLTGMQGGQRKHLLLVDPEGVVRIHGLFMFSLT